LVISVTIEMIISMNIKLPFRNHTMTSFAIFGRQGLLQGLTRIQRFCLALLWVCMTGLALPTLAQPVKGAVYKDFLPMGSGASVALPEGSWLATHVGAMSNPGEEWGTFTLKNQLSDAKVPFLVVRQTTNSGRWGNTSCQSSNPNQYMVNQHGTLISQLVNKCSRMFSIANFETWKLLVWATNPNDKKWWGDVMQGMVDPQGKKIAGIFQIELSVQQFNGKKVRIEAFLLPPKNMGVGKFRDDFKAGQLKTEHDLLAGWTAIYVESIQQSYFNKKPQPIMALAYETLTAKPANPVASMAALSKPTADEEAIEKAHEQRSQDLLRELENTQRQTAAKPNASPVPVVVGTPPPKKEVPSVKPAPVAAAPVAASPATAVASDNLAQIKLDHERRALDEEKRKMTQQLELMNQMLAKLQQENAAVAAAAKAKELAAAAPAPVAPKEPVTYANRKALVIGNDLYKHVAKLNNAAADADAMAKSLEAVGYKVFKHLNLDEKKFKQAVRDFRQNLTGGDEVLFFYAGHGVQLGNANYLLPIDVQGDHEDQVKDDAILLQKVLDDLEEKKTKFALAVIDACRDNPFKGKGRAVGGRGLAPTSAATGQMIMFSAGSGQQALDRLGDNDKEKNGLFTRIFVKEMAKPGLSVDRVLRNVRTEVVRLARSVGHEQTPALYDQAIGEFYFKQ
jgi:hypothetical protein